jgi:chromate transporter
VLFLRLGLVAFGGPAAHVALFRDEFVRRRQWLDDREFAELLAASNLIPGPTSTELAMHLGYRQAGWRGLLAAGTAFAGPAIVIVTLLAWAYVRWGALPEAAAVLSGLAPVIVAIVAHATVALGRSVLRGPALVATAALAVVASLAGVPDVVVLLGGALAGLAAARLTPVPSLVLAALPATLPLVPPAVAATGAASLGLGGLLLVCLKMGAVLFGSGYLLVSLLREELVTGARLLTERQLLDAVAVGQLSPGPVFTTATFVGYLLLGLPGALVATVGFALPAFVFVAASVPVLARLRRSVVARAALEGVSAAVVGLLVAVSAALGGAAIVDPVAAGLAVGALALLVAGRAGPVALLTAGAAVGSVRALVGLG